MNLNNNELDLDVMELPNFPVVSGELGPEFKVEDVFGYFVYWEDENLVPQISRVEGLFVLNKLLPEVLNGSNRVKKVTRRYFWDLDGDLREWDILVPKDIYAWSVDDLVKTEQ